MPLMEPAALAKFGMPRLEGSIPRERLFSLLDDALCSRAVWVGGEPGVGKTTLVASYLSARRKSVVWFRVDEGDGDAGSFFYHLGLGLARVLRRRAGALPLLAPEYRSDLAGFARRYMRDLSAKLSRPVVVVLDDYHRVAADAPLCRCLVQILEEIRPDSRVIVISREAPRRELARMIANRDLAQIDGAEIRLTLDESRLLLGGLGISDEQAVRGMHEQVEGWTAGLILLSARPASRDGTPPRAGHVPNGRAAFNYFAAEIFDRISQELRDLLVHTALFPYFTEAMARSISGNSGARGLLDQLLRDNLFLSRFDGAPERFQYHPLFRSYLLERLAEAYPLHRLTQLRSHAANLLAAQGDEEDAIALYGAAGEWQAATGLVAREAPALLSQGRAQALQTWIGVLPNEVVRRTPVLLYWLGATFQFSQPEHARGLFTEAFSLFERAGERAAALEAAAAAAECLVLEWSDMRGLDRWLPVFERAVRSYPAFGSLEAEMRVLPGMLSAFVYRQSQHPACAKLMTRAEQLIADHPRLHNQMLLGAVAYLRSWTGDFERMDRVVNHLQTLTASDDVSALTRIWWHCAQAYFATLKSDYAIARQAVERAERIAADENLHTMDATIALRGSMAAIASGDLGRASAWCGQAARLLNPHRHIDVCTHSRLQGWIHLLHGDLPQAVDLLRKGADVAVSSGIEIVIANANMVLAMALTEQGDFGGAERLLSGVRSLPLTLASPYLQFSCAVAQTHLAVRRGDDQEAHRSLADAFERGRRHGLKGLTYNWHPGIMAELCARALQRGIEPDYAQSLVARHGLRAPDPAIEEWPWPLHLYCLGRFEIRIGGVVRQGTGKAARKPLELLQLLVANGPRGTPASTLSAVMWPEAEGDAAQNSLNQALHRLRRLLGTDEAIVASDGRLMLDPSLAWVDAWAFDAWTRAAEQSEPLGAVTPERLTALAQRMLVLYQGAFLPGEPGHAGLAGERDRLQSRFRRAVLAVGTALEERERWADAIGLYQRTLEQDNLAESVYRRLMHCHVRLGQPAEALAVYRRCRETLSIIAGLKPGPHTVAAFEALQQSAPAVFSASVRDS